MKGELAEFVEMRLRHVASKGLTIKDAAEALGVHYVTARKYAEEFGVQFPHGLRGGGRKEQRNNEIRRRYLSGEQQIDLAKEYGISRERVRQICDAAGLVTARQRQRDLMATVAGAVQRKSMTLGEAAQMFGISKATVYRYCSEHGVTPARMTAEEVAEFESLASVASVVSINKATGGDRAKAARLHRFMSKKGIKGGGRSRHDDFSERKRIIIECRSRGLSWGEIASRIAVRDGKPIGQGAIYAWARRHLPNLFEAEVAA